MTLEILREINSGIGSTLGDYMFLYGLVFMLKPKSIVEIGTNRGGSAIAMAMALRDSGAGGVIISADIDSQVQELAKQQLVKLELDKYVTLVTNESEVIQRRGHFDMAFIDGDHSYEGILQDFKRLADKTTYLVFHDSMSRGISLLFDMLMKRNDYEVVNLIPFREGKQWSMGHVVYRSITGMMVAKRK